MGERVRVGTRGSRLALVQAEEVARGLRAGGVEAELVVVRTAGDANPATPVARLGVGAFVRELEQALRSGRVDVAVHSAKDLPADPPPDLVVAAYLPRGDPRDALVSRTGAGVEGLPAGALVGSSSPRRRAYLLRARPDLRVVEMRGNVDTRLRKVDRGDCDAVVVAAAGLVRLGLAGRIAEVLPPQTMLPAPGQGAVAVQVRRDDRLRDVVSLLDHLPTRQEVTAEQAFLRTLGAGCRLPVGALARSDGTTVRLEGGLVDPEGRHDVRGEIEGPDPRALGEELARRLLARAVAAGRMP
ncbi:MAG: hydroxymethylbilane synthase [Armatimonadota bacterium]|nr:hydroxymethylbilane synthase [Armatimonadota bacterium]MDR7402389.1 hydroxymethylbilane synthase [Armatimonadota bacterium]MDR7404075.1 hydroxymethylbilane synthase [Armatimonadota bacterium]MDR7437590.1 hydroxymethylbilane synthase [Armatimonadota bacterium]MDR7472184.1 hydroxymethylbilane synthase [Armatimonadota bacterium]